MVLRSLTQSFIGVIRSMLNWTGYDIIRLANKPDATFLGLNTRPIRTVIDVGANVGQFARKAREMFPEAQVVCFEPLSEPYQELKSWSDTQSGHVIAVNCAIGDTTGTTEIHEHLDSSPSSSLLAATSEHQSRYPHTKRQEIRTIQVDTLDDAMTRLDLPLLGDTLIKVDVQGYESRVLSGGEHVFSGAYACVFEVILDSLYDEQTTFQSIYESMTAKGFVYRGNLDQQYGTDGRVMWFDALFTRK